MRTSKVTMKEVDDAFYDSYRDSAGLLDPRLLDARGQLRKLTMDASDAQFRKEWSKIRKHLQDMKKCAATSGGSPAGSGTATCPASSNPAAPAYDAASWNDGGAIQNSTNCYAYAMNSRTGHVSGMTPQPGKAAVEKTAAEKAAAKTDADAAAAKAVQEQLEALVALLEAQRTGSDANAKKAESEKAEALQAAQDYANASTKHSAKTVSASNAVLRETAAKSLDCSSVSAAAVGDGVPDKIVPAPQCPYQKQNALPPPQKNGYYLVALVVTSLKTDLFDQATTPPTYHIPDYHWYRQDSDGGWSHKPGTTQVRREDASGNVIDNPEACDRHTRQLTTDQNGNLIMLDIDYDEFCGYFYVKKGGADVK